MHLKNINVFMIIILMKDKPNYYAIIPANVRYSSLKPNAKLLYGEITALSNKLGYCFASNIYFAELYGVSKNTVSRWLSDLKKLGFITIQIERNSNKEIVKRIIGIVQKDDTLIDKKGKGNNTSINTTSNNIYIKEKFINEVMSFDYSKEMLDDFINYWTEGKRKMRWQKQSTFEIKLRLLRWSKNQKKWHGKKQSMSKIDSQLSEYLKGKEYL
jgi:DNA-binding transcriptional regulator YhcF (GntR family)